MSEPARILVVDDEASILKVIRKQLEIVGYVVDTAQDGVAGLAYAQQTAPDLVILDLMLPKLNGQAVCASLKGDERTRRIPVLMLTANPNPAQRSVDERGADDYLNKPFALAELLQRIRALLAAVAPQPSPPASR